MSRMLSLKEMSIVKHDDAVRNAKVNRGEIDDTRVLRFKHYICGCSAEGCVSVHCIRTPPNQWDNGYF
jgi:hypothetical protein